MSAAEPKKSRPNPEGGSRMSAAEPKKSLAEAKRIRRNTARAKVEEARKEYNESIDKKRRPSVPGRVRVRIGRGRRRAR